MAPKNNFEVLARLENKLFKKTKECGIDIHNAKEFKNWLNNTNIGSAYRIDTRGIPPMIIEAEIANPGCTDMMVVINDAGDVVTIKHNGKLTQAHPKNNQIIKEN